MREKDFLPRAVCAFLAGVITAKLSRLQALGWVALLWAGIYLPALGALEIKGEEGRRILPAIAMLETGNWIVPSVGGVDYLSKPPLINWLVAGAFRLDPTHSEWAARMPCALCALGLGLATVLALSSWLTPSGALVAAVFALTNIGLMEKGRLAEIEGLYVALFGIALVDVARRVAHGGKRLANVDVAMDFFSGWGLLAKGPLHAAFFYVVVIAVLYSAGALRELLNWAHLGGILLMLGIFALWAIPYLHQTAASRVGEVWRAQFEGRMEVNEGFHFAGWILNIPRGLVNFLPWVVLIPLLWRPGVEETWAPGDRAILRGGRTALAGCFLAVSLAPGGLPRYTLPLLTLASVLLALTFTREWETRRLPFWLPKAWARTVLLSLAISMGGALAAMVAAENWLWAVAVVGGLAVGSSLLTAAVFSGAGELAPGNLSRNSTRRRCSQSAAPWSWHRSPGSTRSLPSRGCSAPRTYGRSPNSSITKRPAPPRRCACYLLAFLPFVFLPASRPPLRAVRPEFAPGVALPARAGKGGA